MNGAYSPQPRSVRLALRLFELGVIPRGKFTLVEAKHDRGCPTLVTGSGLDCDCDCEIEVGGRTYSYSEFLKPSQRL
jgi:hypothetical protein